MYVDAKGLFTKDTKLSHATRTTNSKTDVKLLQTVLNRYSAELKFTPLEIDGSFGSLTEAAVNLYKDKYLHDGNTGSNRGVVGYTTWTKLGLPVESTNPKPVSTKPVVVRPIANNGNKGTSAKDVWQWGKMETKFVGESDSKNIYVALLQFWLNELGCMNRNENASDKSNGSYGSQTKEGLANFLGLETYDSPLTEDIWNQVRDAYFEKFECPAFFFEVSPVGDLNITSGMGVRGGRPHDGIDISTGEMKSGEMVLGDDGQWHDNGGVKDIVAGINGTVAKTYWNNSSGYTVGVKLQADPLYVIVYEHIYGDKVEGVAKGVNVDVMPGISKIGNKNYTNSIQIQKNVSVTPTTVIGKVGNSGGSYGSHLHLEIRKYNDQNSADNMYYDKGGSGTYYTLCDPVQFFR